MTKKRKGGKKMPQDFKKLKRKVGRKAPKAANVTDTEFKFQSVGVPMQSMLLDKGNIVTQRNLTFDDIVSHAKHHNDNTRREAFDGLIELLTRFPALLRLQMARILDMLMLAMLDGDSRVRAGSQKSLRIVLQRIRQQNELLLVPFVDLIVAYMSSAVSHVNPAIQHDGLKVVSILLQTTNQIMPRHMYGIMPLYVSCLQRRNEQTDAITGRATAAADTSIPASRAGRAVIKASKAAQKKGKLSQKEHTSNVALECVLETLRLLQRYELEMDTITHRRDSYGAACRHARHVYSHALQRLVAQPNSIVSAIQVTTSKTAAAATLEDLEDVPLKYRRGNQRKRKGKNAQQVFHSSTLPSVDTEMKNSSRSSNAGLNALEIAAGLGEDDIDNDVALDSATSSATAGSASASASAGAASTTAASAAASAAVIRLVPYCDSILQYIVDLWIEHLPEESERLSRTQIDALVRVSETLECISHTACSVAALTSGTSAHSQALLRTRLLSNVVSHVLPHFPFREKASGANDNMTVIARRLNISICNTLAPFFQYVDFTAANETSVWHPKVLRYLHDSCNVVCIQSEADNLRPPTHAESEHMGVLLPLIKRALPLLPGNEQVWLLESFSNFCFACHPLSQVASQCIEMIESLLAPPRGSIWLKHQFALDWTAHLCNVMQQLVTVIRDTATSKQVISQNSDDSKNAIGDTPMAHESSDRDHDHDHDHREKIDIRAMDMLHRCCNVLRIVLGVYSTGVCPEQHVHMLCAMMEELFIRALDSSVDCDAQGSPLFALFSEEVQLAMCDVMCTLQWLAPNVVGGMAHFVMYLIRSTEGGKKQHSIRAGKRMCDIAVLMSGLGRCNINDIITMLCDITLCDSKSADSALFESALHAFHQMDLNQPLWSACAPRVLPHLEHVAAEGKDATRRTLAWSASCQHVLKLVHALAMMHPAVDDSGSLRCFESWFGSIAVRERATLYALVTALICASSNGNIGSAAMQQPQLSTVREWLTSSPAFRTDYFAHLGEHVGDSGAALADGAGVCTAIWHSASMARDMTLLQALRSDDEIEQHRRIHQIVTSHDSWNSSDDITATLKSRFGSTFRIAFADNRHDA
jgi:Rix1 complex component involved in 60S ribosome maturation